MGLRSSVSEGESNGSLNGSAMSTFKRSNSSVSTFTSSNSTNSNINNSMSRKDVVGDVSLGLGFAAAQISRIGRNRTDANQSRHEVDTTATVSPRGAHIYYHSVLLHFTNRGVLTRLYKPHCTDPAVPTTRTKTLYLHTSTLY